jgi:hypothetical protein
VHAPYESLAIGQDMHVELRREPDTGLTLLTFETAHSKLMTD